MKFIKSLIFVGALFASTSAYADTLPTPEEVQGIINVCAAGRSVEVTGELDLAFDKLFSGGVKGEGTISDLGGIIASIEDEKLKTEVYKLYLTCVMPLLLEIASQPEKGDKEKNSSNTTYDQKTYGDKSPIINQPTGTIIFN